MRNLVRVLSFLHFLMADADSDGHELTFSEQKNPTREALQGKRKGIDYLVTLCIP